MNGGATVPPSHNSPYHHLHPAHATELTNRSATLPPCHQYHHLRPSDATGTFMKSYSTVISVDSVTNTLTSDATGAAIDRTVYSILSSYLHH